MRRREAVQVFKEICKCMPDAFVSSISLSPSTPSKTDFDLKLDVALDGEHLGNVEALVIKHGLTLKESKGSLLICGSKAKSDRMQVPLTA